MPGPITSRQNAWFQRFREAFERHEDEIVLEGPKMVRDAVEAGWIPIAVVSTAESDFEPAEGGKHFQIAANLARSLSPTAQPQGVLGLFPRRTAALADITSRRDTVIIALDEVQDPGNVGTIIRLAAAFDAAGVLLAGACADPLGPKAIRASAGAVLSVATANVTREELLEIVRREKLVLVVADANGTPGDPPPVEAILLFGNEGAGVSPQLAKAARTIAIETTGRVESLNVASSVAILLARSFHLRTRATGEGSRR